MHAEIKGPKADLHLEKSYLVSRLLDFQLVGCLILRPHKLNSSDRIIDWAKGQDVGLIDVDVLSHPVIQQVKESPAFHLSVGRAYV
jgi:hypothetical protein